jgi:hypothetical protein
LEDTQETCTCTMFKEHSVTCWYFAAYWIKSNKLCPVVYFYSAVEAQVNMHCCVTGGFDRGIVATIQCVLNQVNSFVKMFLPAGKFIRNQEVLNIRLTTHDAPELNFWTHSCPT